MSTFAPANAKQRFATDGTLAQVVEQWTENPCVLGSTPRGTTPPFIGAVLARGRSLFFPILLFFVHTYRVVMMFVISGNAVRGKRKMGA